MTTLQEEIKEACKDSSIQQEERRGYYVKAN